MCNIKNLICYYIFSFSIYVFLVGCSLTKGGTSIEEKVIGNYYCYNGAYQTQDGNVFIISPSDEPNLRYRKPDGSTGKLFPQDNGTFISGKGWANKENPFLEMKFGSCGDHFIKIKENNISKSARKIDFGVEKGYFENDGLKLYGEFILPERNKPKAIVVLQYGSGRSSAVLNNYVQYLLPLSGIGVFVFDKRGTGNSEGDFTADFQTMAGDLSAAVHRTRQLIQDEKILIGVMGESQGGWVAPLTAINTEVDFVISSYGLAVSPAEENRLEVMQDLENGRYDEQTLNPLERVISATNRIFISNFNEGLEELKTLKEEYGHKNWYKELGGDYTGLFANADAEELEQYKNLFNYPIDLYYDPVPVLYQVDVPMLWVLAEKDTEAPFKETFDIIKKLQADGSPTDIVVFPQAEHGIIAVEDTAEGIKLSDSYAPGYFQILSDWILYQDLKEHYGSAVIYKAGTDKLKGNQ